MANLRQKSSSPNRTLAPTVVTNPGSISETSSPNRSQLIDTMQTADDPDKPSDKPSSEDWVIVNRRLRQHGLPAVKFVHPADVEHLSGKAMCLEPAMNRTVRDSFLSLMSDCDHRQTLVQDLIVKNNQLKDDLARQTAQTEKYFSKMKDLKIMLESSRSRVQELEKGQKFSTSYFAAEEHEKSSNTRAAMHAKLKQLENRCQFQEKEIDRLKQKLHHMSTQEEKRVNRQNQVFQEFRKRTARAHSAMDDKLLDVIDAYEGQIQELQREVEYYKTFGETDRIGPPIVDGAEEDSSSFYSIQQPQQTSSNFKSLVRAYEKQVKDLQRQVKKLEEERELVKLDMGARPEVKDYRVAQLRIKKLEKLLSLHNISIPGEKQSVDLYRMKKKFSTKMEDLDYLPLDLCRQYLKDVSMELHVSDLEQIVPRLQRISNDFDSVHKYEQFCRTVQDLVNSLDHLSDSNRKLGSPKRQPLTQTSLNHLVTVLENWRRDEEGLQELQLSMNRLAERVAPWLKLHLTGEPSVSQLISALDKIIYDDDAVISEEDGKEHPSRSVLANIVQHFQTLFDVPHASGVYPRMNEVYSKLGEVHNVLNTLRNLLGLSNDAKSSAIVDSVGRLCSSHHSTTVAQLKQLLHTEELDSVIRRLEEHSQFFPAFFEVMNKLFEILDIHRMDQVIPAVRALKLLAN